MVFYHSYWKVTKSLAASLGLELTTSSSYCQAFGFRDHLLHWDQVAPAYLFIYIELILYNKSLSHFKNFSTCMWTQIGKVCIS